jgi:hypothetical protein
MTYEIEYTDSQGNSRFHDAIGHRSAMAIAKRLALATGRRTIVRKAPYREWNLLVADLQTGELSRSGHSLTKREAIDLWRQWEAKQDNAVLIFWPKWSSVEPTELVDAG